MCALMISVPGRDPAVSTASPSAPGAGVVSVYYPTRGFNPWNVEDALLPHGGPFHYVLDDFLWSPGYTSDPDNAEPCQSIISERLPDWTRTARFYGSQPGAAVGNAVAVDDFNADGLSDLLVGSPLRDDGAGATFIIFGRIPPLVVGSELSLEELGLPMESLEKPRIFDGLRVVGTPGTRLGQSQNRAGDFNNDGIADVIIGSPLVNQHRGGAAVFFG